MFGGGPSFGCVRGSVWQLQAMRFVGTPSDVAQVLVTCIRDPWPGVCWGLVAWGRSGTCGLGSVGDMWPGVSQGHVAGGLSGTCGPGSAGGPWPGVGRGHVARGRPAARGRRSVGDTGPTLPRLAQPHAFCFSCPFAASCRFLLPRAFLSPWCVLGCEAPPGPVSFRPEPLIGETTWVLTWPGSGRGSGTVFAAPVAPHSGYTPSMQSGPMEVSVSAGAHAWPDQQE